MTGRSRARSPSRTRSAALNKQGEGPTYSERRGTVRPFHASKVVTIWTDKLSGTDHKCTLKLVGKSVS